MKMSSRKKGLILLAIVIGVGIFLRTYNFSDWVHFELDQARDARLVMEAVEGGPGNLPLQGPRAAGSFLRLGPIFYYMEYLSAMVFGATPGGMAAFVLILGTLTLPLFYLFARRYFNTRYSIGLLAVLSVSVFMVLYSRFSWNPNPIPFFMLLTFYSLLRVADKEEKRKEAWFLVFATALAIGTQMHFIVFLAMPIIAAIFLAIKRPRVSWKACVGGFAILFFFYTPVIINDIKTGGENMQEFFEAVTDKSDESDHNIVEKGIRNYTEHAVGNFLVISGQGEVELPKIETRANILKPFDFKCDYDCRRNFPLGLLAGLFFTLGIMLLVWRFFKAKSGPKKDFLLMSGLWLAVSVGIMTPFAYDHAPRFYLVTAPIAFVLVGLIMEFIDNKRHRKSWVVIFIFLTLMISNSVILVKRFEEMRYAPIKELEAPTDRILKERATVTVEQQKMIVDYMLGYHERNGGPIFMYAESFYQRSLDYFIDKTGVERERLSDNTVYEIGNHFLVYRTAANLEDRLEKYRKKYEVVEQKTFGTLTLFRLEPKPEEVTAEEKVFKKENECKEPASRAQKRYTWNEIFKTGECFTDEDEESDEGGGL